jgi:hypothetical protein
LIDLIGDLSRIPERWSLLVKIQVVVRLVEVLLAHHWIHLRWVRNLSLALNVLLLIELWDLGLGSLVELLVIVVGGHSAA